MEGSPSSIREIAGTQNTGYFQEYTGYILADPILLPWLFLSVCKSSHWLSLLWDFRKTASSSGYVFKNISAKIGCFAIHQMVPRPVPLYIQWWRWQN